MQKKNTQTELETFYKNSALELVGSLALYKIINYKYIFKLKYKEIEIIFRCKVWLVAQDLLNKTESTILNFCCRRFSIIISLYFYSISGLSRFRAESDRCRCFIYLNKIFHKKLICLIFFNRFFIKHCLQKACHLFQIISEWKQLEKI